MSRLEAWVATTAPHHPELSEREVVAAYALNQYRDNPALCWVIHFLLNSNDRILVQHTVNQLKLATATDSPRPRRQFNL
jgi:hypothetical protein